MQQMWIRSCSLLAVLEPDYRRHEGLQSGGPLKVDRIVRPDVERLVNGGGLFGILR
jgi:hypothetical protein